VHAYGYENHNLATSDADDDWENHKKAELEESKKQLQEINKEIKATGPNPDHSFETIAVLGYLVDAVNDLVNQENADLVVMVIQGNATDRNIALGSNTIQVLKFVQCPVLGIPLGYVYGRPAQIAFPSNLSIPFHRRELKLISCLAKSCRSLTHLLYIANFDILSVRQQEVKAFWESRFRESKIKHHRSDEGNHAFIIKEYVNRNDIDLLVMINSNHSFLESVIQASTVDKLGLSLKIPFLILQNKPRQPQAS
jgi:nucleotide-binding universal stress UspA family protein